jgi:hypothetical protein
MKGFILTKHGLLEGVVTNSVMCTAEDVEREMRVNGHKYCFGDITELKVDLDNNVVFYSYVDTDGHTGEAEIYMHEVSIKNAGLN